MPATRLLLLALAALDAAAAGRCDGPFKTLSSDCRGLPYDATTACLVLPTGSSPCASGAVRVPADCGRASGFACDVLSYNIKYQPTLARFHVRFPTRQLQTDTATSPPPLNANGTNATIPLPLPLPPTFAPPPTDTPQPTDPHTTRVPPMPPISPLPPPTIDPSSPPPVVFPTTTPPPQTFQPSPSRVDYVTVRPPINGGDETQIPSESNEFVDTIGALRLDPALTDVRIVGGASEFGIYGQAVQLQIDPAMLVQSPHVTSLWIVNCAVGEQLASEGILGGLPSGLVDLNLQNTLMRTEPKDMSALQNLQSLSMGQNYLATLSNKVALPKLMTLDLTENALASFDAKLPILEFLYLSSNKLDAIPEAVYSMSNLRELSLSQNPIVAIVVSTTQYDFLAKLRLKLDQPPTLPPEPVIYWSSDQLPTDPNAFLVDPASVDLSIAVPIRVGTLTMLQGVPVWKLPDPAYKFFMAQQQFIAKTGAVVAGKKVPTYLAQAAESAAKAPVTSKTSTTAASPSAEETPMIGPATSGPATSGPISTTTTPSGNTGTTGSPLNSLRESPAVDTPTRNAPGANHRSTLSAWMSVLAAIAALVAGLVFVRRRQRRSNISNASVMTPKDGSASTAPYQATTDPKPSNSDSMGSFGAITAMHDDAVRDLFSSRRIRASDLEAVRPIGTGATGVVWLVHLRGARPLASKRLIESVDPSSPRLTQFVNEILVASSLDHPSIVAFVGVAWTSETDLQALYEYMPNGDLQTHLHKTLFPWSVSKLQTAIDIVEALVYTHSFNPPLLHRNLRARNVLLDDDMNPKLSNFGSARFASEQNTMTTDGIGSGRWLASEILKGSTDYATASDMYAFGVLLSELDSHATPYQDAEDEKGNTKAEIEVLALVARGDLRPTLSSKCPREIRDLAMRCWMQDPHARPTAIQVAYELRVLMREWES